MYVYQHDARFPYCKRNNSKISIVEGGTWDDILTAPPQLRNNRTSTTIEEKHHDIIVTSMTSHTIYIATAYLTWNQHELLRNVALAQDIPDFSCLKTNKMSSKKAIRAIEEIGRTNVKPMTPAHRLDHLYGMKASVLDLLIGNDNLRYDKAGIQREMDGVGEQIERSCDLVDELRQKEHCLSMAEPSLLRSNRLLKTNEKALIEEVMSLRRRAHRLTSPIEEPDCSKEGELDLLKSPHARVNQKSIIPRSKSRPKVVKKPSRRRKVVSSATQLQTIYEDDEPIIPLTAKSAVVLSGESKIHITAVANMETKKNKKHSIPWSTKVRDTISESDDIPTIRLQEQPPIPRPKFHKMVHDSPRFLLTDTFDIIDDVATIHMEEESGNTSAANKPTTKKQNPATDFSIFIGGKKSIPRKVMFAEQLKKKSLLPRLCKLFKTQKADRVEEIELPKREKREVLTAPVSRKPAAPSGSKIPLFRRAPKKKKSLIPTLRKFFKTPKADRVEEIELPKRERREVLTAPVSRKLAAPSGSKIPLFRRAPKKKKSLIPTLRKFFKTPKADRVEEIELPKTERREVLTAPGSHKPAGSSGSKIPLFRHAQILHQRFLPMPERE